MTLNKSIEEEVEEAGEVEMLEDVGWGAIGSSIPKVEDAREFLKLTDKDIAKVYRYDELLDEILSNPANYEHLNRQQSL